MPIFMVKIAFLVTIFDGKDFVTKTISITVNSINDAPIVAKIDAQVMEDKVLILDVLTSASDVDDSLTIISVGNSSNGTTKIVGDYIMYVPNHNYNGQDSFEYKISDGKGGITKQNPTVTVNPGNDAPVLNGKNC